MTGLRRDQGPCNYEERVGDTDLFVKCDHKATRGLVTHGFAIYVCDKHWKELKAISKTGELARTLREIVAQRASPSNSGRRS